jgi:branched-chain amino acid transport system substrate-binding protein
MNRRSCIAAVLAALSMTLAAGALAQQGLKTGKVGVIVQLSGVSADFGVGVQHAVEIAKQELAEKGIVNLQVSYEDHQQQAQLALVGFEKLVDRNDVSVVIANASPVILALAPVAEERKRLVYNFAGVSPKLRGLSRWVINGAALSDLDGNELANYMVKSLGIKTAAVIHVDDQFGTSVAEYFQNAFKKAGGKIVDVQTNPVGALDLRTQLLKIKNANPEALVILNNIPEEGYTVAQARELGLVGEAIQKVGNDPLAIRNYIVKVKDWPGAIGKINFDADGGILLNMSRYEFVNGKPVFGNQ